MELAIEIARKRNNVVNYINKIKAPDIGAFILCNNAKYYSALSAVASSVAPASSAACAAASAAALASSAFF